ncbi:MAG: Spy/CpxP family protein refolding chaperone [Acidobacteriota bacterium]
MFIRRILPAVAVTIVACGAVAFAQDTATPSPRGSMRSERMGRGERRKHDREGRRAEFGLMRGLDLTEAQKQQQRTIMQRHLDNIKGPREELLKLREKRIAGSLTPEDEARAQSLRQSIQTSMRSMRSEMESILTTEQRTKLEQLQSERKVRHEEMRERRQELKPEVPR